MSRQQLRIYLISSTGAISTDNPRAARAAEQCGYKRCSREEWQRKRRWQEREDEKVARSERAWWPS